MFFLYFRDFNELILLTLLKNHSCNRTVEIVLYYNVLRCHLLFCSVELSATATPTPWSQLKSSSVRPWASQSWGSFVALYVMNLLCISVRWRNVTIHSYCCTHNTATQCLYSVRMSYFKASLLWVVTAVALLHTQNHLNLNFKLNLTSSNELCHDYICISDSQSVECNR